MQPAYAFSIPSVEDDTPLDCRIYHPEKLASVVQGVDHVPWIKGAILAHPYAPRGGCQDDHVVLATTETLLDQGFVVGTFNFRCVRSLVWYRLATDFVQRCQRLDGQNDLDWEGGAAGLCFFYRIPLLLPQPPSTANTAQRHCFKQSFIATFGLCQSGACAAHSGRILLWLSYPRSLSSNTGDHHPLRIRGDGYSSRRDHPPCTHTGQAIISNDRRATAGALEPSWPDLKTSKIAFEPVSSRFAYDDGRRGD